MNHKLIGVSPRILTEKGVEKEFVNKRYLIPLQKRQFNTIMLTTDNPDLEAILNLCDGFLITGGADIHPKHFNEENKGESRDVIESLDEVDQNIILHAVKHNKPVLGICRGHQAINIFLGGSLYQDIGTSHNQEPHTHEINSIKNDFLNFEEKIVVNTYHHQSLKKLAPDLEVIATHNDGTIEAIVHQKLPIFGVQWHPEINADSPESILIFDKFASLFNK